MKQDEYEKPSGIAIGIVIGIWLSVFIVGCVKCHAQNLATISKSETVQQDTKSKFGRLNIGRKNLFEYERYTTIISRVKYCFGSVPTGILIGEYDWTVGHQSGIVAYKKKDSSAVFVRPELLLEVRNGIDSSYRMIFDSCVYATRGLTAGVISGSGNVNSPDLYYSPNEFESDSLRNPVVSIDYLGKMNLGTGGVVIEGSEINQDEPFLQIRKPRFNKEPKLIHAPGQLPEPKTDTIPVTILVRISGKPWAFFHDGWEVRKVAIDDGNRSQPGSMLLWHDASAVGKPIYSHLLYLDSRKRPIRKEWVVYDKYSRK